ncbi:MAG TPA: FAD-dependent oxidoreductase [Candidatus Sabulitectum sp.]|mgnify:CR=1 FL=1|nr:FAD-dependent oxidoreductase [Candidatus Sabulitectum sp.]HPJ29327.1 FAD-dependent oxidoreductase [Candidatus Sabulitectum sp.]HPR22513.1 FAD-dependent oxidoreductase [Candidatus Sabulitectum sp.]
MKKLVIVGGVAGGASAAARARRLDENLEITVFERGRYVSYANCGLPYHLSGTIPSRDSLLLMTPELFFQRFNVKIRTGHLVTSIDPERHTVTVRELFSGHEFQEPYDKLILSPGSSPVKPPIPGADDRDVYVLWTIPDMDAIKGRMEPGSRAVVIGGGFIGVEVAENLAEAGVETTLVEMQRTILPPLDDEMTVPLEKALVEGGVALRTSTAVKEFRRDPSGLLAVLDNGEEIRADFAVMAAGVRPNGELASSAGIETSGNGAIMVNSRMETSVNDIYAVGDAVMVQDPVTGCLVQVPLAGPANRQGRIAAENALGGNSEYRGTYGTSIVKVFHLAAGSTGASEGTLRKCGIEYRKAYLHPVSHASYYPGGAMMTMKFLFSPEGRILGMQAVGEDGVDKRIDVVASAIRNGMSVHDLEELELCYAPPFGSAKDPVNFAGFVAGNILAGLTEPAYPDEMPEDAFLLDVREEEEAETGRIPGSVLIPLGDLRGRMGELPLEREILVYCAVGIRGYAAERILKQKGYRVRNLSGGYAAWCLFRKIGAYRNPDEIPAAPPPPLSQACEPCRTIDATGLQCPGPIVRVTRAAKELEPGDVMRITATDRGFAGDLPAWCASTGNQLLSMENEKGVYSAMVKKGERKENSGMKKAGKSTAMVLFSNDLDKAMAAMIIATGYAALGHEVTVFSTFWGLSAFRREHARPGKKDAISRMFGMMLPGSAKRLALSKMNMMGAGTAMMKHVMKKKNVETLPELIEQAKGMGVRFVACEMCMNIMGLQREELMEGMDVAGVAEFASISENADATLFI